MKPHERYEVVGIMFQNFAVAIPRVADTSLFNRVTREHMVRAGIARANFQRLLDCVMACIDFTFR